MTPQQAKELLPIIAAFSEGKEIQCEGMSCGKWVTPLEPNFSPELKWRIKPEPREFWVNEYASGVVRWYDTPNEADQNRRGAGDFLRTIHFREVISPQ